MDWGAGAAVVAAAVAVVGVLLSNRNAQQSIQALETPFLIPDYEALKGWVIPWVDGVGEGRPWYLDIPLINVGRGPAMMGDVRVSMKSVGDVLDRPGGQIAMPVERPTNCELNTRDEPLPLPIGEVGLMRIYYTSASGQRHMTYSPFMAKADGILCIRFELRDSDDEERNFIFEEAAIAPPSPR
ncbi:MAG TPA: hypothetical protein VFJ57_10060 [Solirubrobacterales bacterium]|nr:hypothetical protein [Solirubrobacterales bacterium]